MTERPILFTPENAQKVFDGTKTQTRRIIKPQPLHISWFDHQNSWCARVRDDTGSAEHPAYVMVPCPYGVVGDRLWIREAWRLLDYQERKPGPAYRGEKIQRLAVEKWKPSIHMPRWARRTVVEITEIRVEQLHAMSMDDVRAEGVKAVWPELDEPYSSGGKFVNEDELLRVGWIRLWESINGKDSWALNPWVWCLTFRKVTL